MMCCHKAYQKQNSIKKVIIKLNISLKITDLEADGQGSSPYSRGPYPRSNPKLRGNPITLNLHPFYNHVDIYIITD